MIGSGARARIRMRAAREAKATAADIANSANGGGSNHLNVALSSIRRARSVRARFFISRHHKQPGLRSGATELANHNPAPAEELPSPTPSDKGTKRHSTALSPHPNSSKFCDVSPFRYPAARLPVSTISDSNAASG